MKLLNYVASDRSVASDGPRAPVHSAEYFRERRARKRAEAIAAGTYKPHGGRGAAALMDEIPAEVYERGKILRLMMRTHPSQWKPEWLDC
jgi:hypothetical protein